MARSRTQRLIAIPPRSSNQLFPPHPPPLKITKPIRLIELFAGIGAQAKSLERLNANFEHYRICEIDKFAIKSYNSIHHTNFQKSDITQIFPNDLAITNTKNFCYIMTYSFPCSDLSKCGKQMGMSKGANTRSSLLWEVERLLKSMKDLPQILLMENVPQVVGKRNIADFEQWISFLNSLGYTSKWALLNASDFNIPQNRNRCYMMSWLGDYSFEFPRGDGCKRILRDVLEKNVDEKYYLSEKGIEYVLKREGSYTQLCDEDTPIAPSAITAKGNNNWTGNFIVEKPSIIVAGTIVGGGYENNLEYNKRIYDPSGIAPACKGASGGGHQTKIIEPTKRIRKLTPRECFRLMGFDDDDFDKIKAARISDTQAYKQAGNTIVVPVLEAIFGQLLN